MIRHLAFVVVLMACFGTVSAQQKPIKIVTTTNVAKACNPKDVPTNGAFLGTYQCSVAKKSSFACDVYIFTGACFGVVMYNYKKEFVQVDIIKAGKRHTVWKVEMTSR
ncbi:MAG: hypothetical protein NUV98_02310 [Candidatus Roizmanbacteria bacterium]|nr:hypothetical protein [Candidatus Roizmanbacteria bacterium]